MQDIIQKGTVISEFPLGPSRKVAISLSGTESLADSVTGQLSSKQGTGGGVILTVFNALDQNREVFAVPGWIADERSKKKVPII